MKGFAMPIFKCNNCGADVERRSPPSLGHVKVHYCNMDCKREWQRSQKPVTREWLVEHYITKGMDCTQIAKIVGRDSKSVWNWLKDLEIPTRKRGYASTKPFVKGDPRTKNRPPMSAETKAKIRAAALADGRVPFHRHIGPPMKGKRGAETTNWKGGITPLRQQAHGSPEWKECVKAVWKRDNATCQRCNLHKSSARDIAFDIHHIVSFGCSVLRFEVSNLVLLCEPCHYWVHSSNNTEKLFLGECEHGCFESAVG